MSIRDSMYEYTLVIVFEEGSMPTYYRIPNFEITPEERRLMHFAHVKGKVRQDCDDYPEDYIVWRLNTLDHHNPDEREEIVALHSRNTKAAKRACVGKWSDYYRTHPIDTEARFCHVYCFREPQNA